MQDTRHWFWIPALCSNMADVTWSLALRGVKRGGFGMRCSGKCQFPGWLIPCPMCCVLVHGHSFACVCLRHRAKPSAPPFPAVPRPGPSVHGPEPQLRTDRFGAVVKVVEQLGAEDRLLALRARGVRALGDLYPLCDTEESCMEVLSVSRSTFLRVVDSVTGVSVKLSSPPALARGDHPHFEPSQRGSLQKALEAISTSSGRDGVLQQADSLTTAASTQIIATAWRVPPLPLTPTTVRCVLATFRAGRISFTSKICW